MDPISVIILAAIYAALRGPREAGRSMRQDYRNRRDRWGTRAENWSTGRGRGRGGQRVAGFDRNGRAYRRSDYNRGSNRNGRWRGDPGWRTDSRAWTGPEGRARVARGVRPAAIRSGIVAGALAYTAVFGLGVASRGFARGLSGGYQMGRLHYLGKRNQAQDPTATVTPGPPGEQPGPNDEVVDAVIVEDPNTDTSADGAPAPDTDARPQPESDPEPVPAGVPELTETAPPAADLKNGPWLLIVHGPGVNRWNGSDSEGFGVFDAADLDRRLNLIAGIPGLTAEVRPLPDDFEDSRSQTATGPATATPGDDSVSENTTAQSTARPGLKITEENKEHVRNGLAAMPREVGLVSIGSTINAPVLMEGANYHAHLHNLNVIAKEARHEYSSAELTLASASAARQRAEFAMTAVEQMAAGLAAQDFGEPHVGNMASLYELLGRHVEHARTAENAARESLATSEQLIEVCMATAAAFQRDHGQLAEAHASAPHAAKTREAYQPM